MRPRILAFSPLLHTTLCLGLEVSFRPAGSWSLTDSKNLTSALITSLPQPAHIASSIHLRAETTGAYIAPTNLRDIRSSTSRFVTGPNVRDRATLLSLAKSTWDAYFPTPDNVEWYDVDGNIWTSPFGWVPGDGDGLRGHVFLSEDGKQGIISFKGTSLSILDLKNPFPLFVKRDQKNDNILFSCCCADVPWTLRSNRPCSCTSTDNQCCTSCLHSSLTSEESYYVAAERVVERFQRMYPVTKFWLTGHSLGGSIAALVGLKYSLPVVAFEAPGERLAATRLGLTTAQSATQVEYITHVYNSLDPLAHGTCTACAQFGFAMESKCHVGQVIRLELVVPSWEIPRLPSKPKIPDLRPYLVWHLIDTVIKVLENATLEIPTPTPQLDCEDCSSWSFLPDTCPIRKPQSIWELIKALLFGWLSFTPHINRSFVALNAVRALAI